METKSKINRHVRSKPPISDPDLPYKNIANALKKILSRHYPNNKVTDAHIKSWTKTIKSMFRTVFTGSPEQVLEWLRVYYTHFDRNNKYHVVIMSGESLKEKIIKLEGFVNTIRREVKPETRKIQEVSEQPKRRLYNDPNAMQHGQELVANFDD